MPIRRPNQPEAARGRKVPQRCSMPRGAHHVLPAVAEPRSNPMRREEPQQLITRLGVPKPLHASP
jgi:hypothetical protein